MELTNIIREELNNLINEGYVMEHDNFKFTQQVKTCSFYNYESFSTDHDVDISEHNIVINWRIGFWLNDMGVENFLVQGDGVVGTYTVLLLDKQTDEEVQEIEKNIAEIPWKFQIDDAKLYLNKSLYVEYLDFDFKSKICRITFYDPANY